MDLEDLNVRRALLGLLLGGNTRNGITEDFFHEFRGQRDKLDTAFIFLEKKGLVTSISAKYKETGKGGAKRSGRTNKVFSLNYNRLMDLFIQYLKDDEGIPKNINLTKKEIDAVIIVFKSSLAKSFFKTFIDNESSRFLYGLILQQKKASISLVLISLLEHLLSEVSLCAFGVDFNSESERSKFEKAFEEKIKIYKDDPGLAPDFRKALPIVLKTYIRSLMNKGGRDKNKVKLRLIEKAFI